MTHQPSIIQFSNHLFWDVKRDQIDVDKNREYIIRQVLEYGKLSDWKLIRSYYGILQVAEIAMNFRTLDKKALSFSEFSELRLVGGTALALQTGHRKSIDLDLFGKVEMEKLPLAELFAP